MAKVLIFADGKVGIGFGHLSRAQALQAELQTLGLKSIIYDSTLLNAQTLQASNPTLIAIDSYTLPIEAYTLATHYAKACIFFDDTLRLPYPSGQSCAIVNNAPSVDAKAYQQKYPNNSLFLGDSFTLLRPAFTSKPAPILKEHLKECLITLGAEDILKLNAHLIQALAQAYPKLNLHCIAKDSLPNAVFHLNATQMAETIRTMDICICAAGQTLREILSCGIPAIVLEVTPNQHANFQSFETCTLTIPQAYTLEKSVICQKVLTHLQTYIPLHKRQLHQTLALSLLKHENKWQSALENLLNPH